MTPLGSPVDPEVYWSKTGVRAPVKGSFQALDSGGIAVVLSHRRPARPGKPESKGSTADIKAEELRVAAGRASEQIKL